MTMTDLGSLPQATQQLNGAQDSRDRYFRTVNYLDAAQVYLRENCLLNEALQPEHIASIDSPGRILVVLPEKNWHF